MESPTPDKTAYLTTQILTYMGNKRKLLSAINAIVSRLEEREKRGALTMGDGFSGSGIVSRALKTRASVLYTNDIADYAFSLNQCFLTNITPMMKTKLLEYIEEANYYADSQTEFTDPYVSGNWAPLGETIQSGERVYFTHTNGRRIDIYRNYIETLPSQYQPYLLGMLLVEASIHNNTNGQFSAYYKNGDIGHYGGKHEIDLQRIEKPIQLSMPVHWNNACQVHITQKDALEWVRQLPPLDLVYYDPPYNKHPYSIYYFLLNVIQKWDKTAVIPESTRGQPLGWHRSEYNSFKHATQAFETLIQHTKAKYILISYNNGGIIPLNTMDTILAKYGHVEKIPVEHKTYNRLKGISEYKRATEKEKIREFFWLVTTF